MAATIDQAVAALPTDWGSYGAAQKIDYYNANNITTDQLKASGASDADLGWMAQNGYTAGGAATSAPVAAAAPATAYSSAPAATAAPSAQPGGMLYSTPALPSNWGSYGGKQKIDFYNANNITTDQLKAAGVSDADLGRMSQNGYTVGQSPVAAGVERGVTAWGSAPDNDFAKMIYAGGANDAVATQRGLQYAKEQGWTPEQAVAQWNAALGSNLTVDDYNIAMRNHGMFGAGTPAPAGAPLTPEQMAGIKAAYGGNSADLVNPYVLQYAKEQGWTQEQTLKAINQTMGSNLGASDFAEGVNYYGFQWQDPQTSSAPAAINNVSTNRFNPNLDRSIDAASETIEGRLNNLLKTDERGNYTSPVVRQAVDRAMQQMAGRGLLNSSMATQAAQEAAIAKAIEIVGPDAERYFQQGRANQDAQNVFARDEINYGYDLSKMSYANQLELGKMGYANQLDLGKMGVQQSYEREKLTQAGSQFNQELAYKYDALKLDDATRTEAETRAHQYALEIKEMDAVNSAYDLYLRRISDIDNNKDYDAATKIQMKNAAGKDFDLYAKAKGIAWEMDLGNRFAASGATDAGGMISSAINSAANDASGG